MVTIYCCCKAVISVHINFFISMQPLYCSVTTLFYNTEFRSDVLYNICLYLWQSEKSNAYTFMVRADLMNNHWYTTIHILNVTTSNKITNETTQSETGFWVLDKNYMYWKQKITLKKHFYTNDACNKATTNNWLV